MTYFLHFIGCVIQHCQRRKINLELEICLENGFSSFYRLLFGHNFLRNSTEYLDKLLQAVL